MSNFLEFLNSIGIHVNENSAPILLFACSIWILAIVSMLCFINIMFYFSILYILDNEKVLIKLSQWPFLIKIINFYKSIRTGFIVFELILFIISLGSIIWLCSRIIFGLLN